MAGEVKCCKYFISSWHPKVDSAMYPWSHASSSPACRADYNLFLCTLWYCTERSSADGCSKPSTNGERRLMWKKAIDQFPFDFLVSFTFTFEFTIDLPGYLCKPVMVKCCKDAKVQIDQFPPSLSLLMPEPWGSCSWGSLANCLLPPLRPTGPPSHHRQL